MASVAEYLASQKWITRDILKLLGQRLDIEIKNSDKKTTMLEKFNTWPMTDVIEELDSIREERGINSAGVAIATIKPNIDIRKHIQPFEKGADIQLYLKNFERVCTTLEIPKTSWVSMLFCVLPPSVTEVLGRLPDENLASYDKTKEELFKHFRLSASALKNKFKSRRREGDESFVQLGFILHSTLVDYLKSCEVYEDYDATINQLCIDQFISTLPEAMRLFIQDRLKSGTKLTEVCELADDYSVTRRDSFNTQYNKRFVKPFNSRPTNKEFNEQFSAINQTGITDSAAQQQTLQVQKPSITKETFEQRRSTIQCFHCKKFGHTVSRCREKNKELCGFTSTTKREDNLLSPYIKNLMVNGKECPVLRDTGATIDVVHTDYVSPEDFTGRTIWIRQPLVDQMICLPMAKVRLEIESREFKTEAAVSPHLPDIAQYLLSNASCKFLDDNSQSEVSFVGVLTRAQTSNLMKNEEHLNQTDSVNKIHNTLEKANSNSNQLTNTILNPPESGSNEEKTVFLPSSDVNYSDLFEVDNKEFSKLQHADTTLVKCWSLANSNIESNTKIVYNIQNTILRRFYTDKNNRSFDQLVVPTQFRNKLLHVAHSNFWAGHLAIKKTKRRLLQEFYWPGCFKEVEQFVKSCQICQVIGKPHEKIKAPMITVPIISTPFQRVVVDVVGPLPKSKEGYKYILTLLCVATKFPDATPLQEATSVTIVQALLTIFSRLGFPSEIQTDQGTVFTSALTLHFLNKCGIKVYHSSIHHPQSNSVERLHGTIKRILRALCLEQDVQWPECLPAALFAIRSIPNETTGFSPAELMYGRSLRSPLSLIREVWERPETNKSVVEYVLELLDRLSKQKELVEANLSKAQITSKRYYDQKARERTYKPGDQVLFLNPSRKNKLEVYWLGPATVVEKISDTNYVIEYTPGKRKKDYQIYHTNLLKPYIARAEQANMVICNVISVPNEVNNKENNESEMELDIPSWFVYKAGGDSCNAKRKIDHLPESNRNKLLTLITEFEDIFSLTPGLTDVLTFDVELESKPIIKTKVYRTSPKEDSIIKKEIDNLLKLGIIKRGSSDYLSPLLLIQVPGKDPRPCIDYRGINKITRTLVFPMPNLEECVEKVSRAKFISCLDLVRGYWQMPLTSQASRFSAFICKEGTFLPQVMMFGQKNAPYYFQRLMSIILEDLQEFAIPYLDDISIFSKSWEDHMEHLQIVFERLRKANLKVKLEKCQFAKGSVTYLGHEIGQGFRRPLEAKISTIQKFPFPRTKKEIRIFLGLAGYYQHYIPHFSSLAAPFTDCLKKSHGAIITPSQELERNFQALKTSLTCNPVLRSPDYNKQFLVQTDCSDRGMGVILAQVDENEHEYAVIFLNRKLKPREEAYCATEKECACIVWALAKLQCYLRGSTFIIETDHAPLTWLNSIGNKSSRLLRWSLELQQYNFTIRYKKGSQNSNADGLSRAF